MKRPLLLLALLLPVTGCRWFLPRDAYEERRQEILQLSWVPPTESFQVAVVVRAPLVMQAANEVLSHSIPRSPHTRSSLDLPLHTRFETQAELELADPTLSLADCPGCLAARFPFSGDSEVALVAELSDGSERTLRDEVALSGEVALELQLGVSRTDAGASLAGELVGSPHVDMEIRLPSWGNEVEPLMRGELLSLLASSLTEEIRPFPLMDLDVFSQFAPGAEVLAGEVDTTAAESLAIALNTNAPGDRESGIELEECQLEGADWALFLSEEGLAAILQRSIAFENRPVDRVRQREVYTEIRDVAVHQDQSLQVGVRVWVLLPQGSFWRDLSIRAELVLAEDEILVEVRSIADRGGSTRGFIDISRRVFADGALQQMGEQLTLRFPRSLDAPLPAPAALEARVRVDSIDTHLGRLAVRGSALIRPAQPAEPSER